MLPLRTTGVLDLGGHQSHPAHPDPEPSQAENGIWPDSGQDYQKPHGKHGHLSDQKLTSGRIV